MPACLDMKQSTALGKELRLATQPNSPDQVKDLHQPKKVAHFEARISPLKLLDQREVFQLLFTW